MTLILGIETSCDETAAAVVQDGHLVRSNIVASQHDLHRKYRGVVPEIASRAHLQRIMTVLTEALEVSQTSLEQIDAVAIGNRPGLIGSLLVGVSAAQALAWSLAKPLIGVDHVRAHLYAAALTDNNDTAHQSPLYPALGLVVSGGHTSLYEIIEPTHMRLLGKTIDDAAGEAYDKAAVILDAGYPGGPKLDALAQSGQASIKLPRSMLASNSLDFSFSGLKTALLYNVRGKPTRIDNKVCFEKTASDLSETQRADLADAFQEAVIDVLILKIERAIDKLTDRHRPPRCVVIGGGVSANSLLRNRAAELSQHRGLDVHLPATAFCLDNAAMIAGLAFQFFRQGRFDPLDLPAIATLSE